MVEQLSLMNDTAEETRCDSLIIGDSSGRHEIDAAAFEALVHEVLNLRHELQYVKQELEHVKSKLSNEQQNVAILAGKAPTGDWCQLYFRRPFTIKEAN